MPTYQAPRGMRDLLPAEAAAFDALQAVIQARALRYGYPRLGTPIVEDAQVFLRAVGETSDVATKEMLELGATLPEFQPGETWRVLLDPSGHPFCLTQAANWG